MSGVPQALPDLLVLLNSEDAPEMDDDLADLWTEIYAFLTFGPPTYKEYDPEHVHSVEEAQERLNALRSRL